MNRLIGHSQVATTSKYNTKDYCNCNACNKDFNECLLSRCLVTNSVWLKVQLLNYLAKDSLPWMTYVSWMNRFLESRLHYDRQSVGQSVLVSSTHLGFTTTFLFLSDSCGFCWCEALSDERTDLPFTIAAGPRQCSHSWVQVPQDSWPYFNVSDSRLPQPGGPGPHIYIPQEQGGPVIPPGTGFLFFASYDSQGYGGGIRTRLHAGKFLESLHGSLYRLILSMENHVKMIRCHEDLF
jgi:hypothetical protein